MVTDTGYTKKIQDWLLSDHSDEDNIVSGARLLYGINRNQQFLQNVMRRPFKLVAKLEYELKKHLGYRLQNMTLADVVKLDHDITPKIAALIQEGEKGGNADGSTAHRGRRADHDTLPDGVKKLFDDNADRYKRIKALYETCSTFELACDRYEYLVQLKDAFYTYKKDMQRYDDYKPENGDTVENNMDVDAGEDKGGAVGAAASAKDINNARSYLTKNAQVLKELAGSDNEADIEKARILREKMQQRVDLLVANNAEYSEDTAMAWAELGLKAGNGSEDKDC